MRRAALRHWRSRADRLHERELRLHEQMHPDVAKVMDGKRLLLMKEMLLSVGFERTDALIKHLVSGFPLAGAFPATGVLPPAARPAALSVEDLWRTARTTQRRTSESCRSTGDAQVDQEVYEATLAEKDRGWLDGPLSEEQLDAMGAWVPSRRFGVGQGVKLRVIQRHQ